MSLYKRLSATLFARIDDSVRQIENHDAVIEVSLRDARRMAAQAKVRINRVRADGEKLASRLQSLQQAEIKWTERAREQADQDEDTALECLRRRRDCQQQIAGLEQSIARHKKVETRLCAEAKRLEEQLGNIAHQRNLMRSRQSAAEVNRCLQEIRGRGGIDIDDTFERWEMQITETEMTSVPGELEDDLDKRFLDAEMRADLQAELRTISKGGEA